MSFLETFAAGLSPVEREMKGEPRLLKFEDVQKCPW